MQIVKCKIKNDTGTLAGVAQWRERWPANQKVASSFSVMAHAWVVGQGPGWGGGGQEATDQCISGTSMFLSLSFSLLSSFSKNK